MLRAKSSKHVHLGEVAFPQLVKIAIMLLYIQLLQYITLTHINVGTHMPFTEGAYNHRQTTEITLQNNITKTWRKVIAGVNKPNSYLFLCPFFMFKKCLTEAP